MQKIDRAKVEFMEWGDIKRRFMEIVEKGKPAAWSGQHGLDEQCRRWHDDTYGAQASNRYMYDWEGANAGVTMDALRNGFRAPELAHAYEHAFAEKTSAVWSDEDGDPDAGFLLGGRDDFFFSVESRPAKPALTLNIEFSFSATIKAPTIVKYGAWLAGWIGALEAAGYDLEVNVLNTGTDAYTDSRNEITDCAIRVKRIGEISDFTEWSALFSPAGWRHLMFTAIVEAGVRRKRTVTGTLGMPRPLTNKWGIHREDDGAITVTVANRDGDPTEALTEAAKALALS